MIKKGASLKISIGGERWVLPRFAFGRPVVIWDLITLNRALLGVLAGLSFLWAVWAVGGAGKEPLVSASSAGVSSQSSMAGAGSGSVVRLKDLTARELFRPLVHAPPPPVPKPVEAPPPPSVPKIPLSQRASQLSLVGILPGPPPQAVIEDKRQGGTAYVSVGERVGEISILKISSDRVTLSFEDETLDLAL